MCDEALYLVDGKVFTQKFLDGVRYVTERFRLGEITHKEILDMKTFLDHRGNDEEENTSKDASDDNKGTQDTKDAILHPATDLEEPDHRE